jgi:hypothetical protein
MHIDINKSNINNINNTLLIILLILVIFCICFYIYNGINNGTNNAINMDSIIHYNNYNNDVDNKIILLETMIKAQEQAEKIKESFTPINNKLILATDANDYYNNINTVQYWLDNSYNGSNGILADIHYQLKNAANTRNLDKQALLNLLTNIYILNYLNYNNKQNAESYKVYSKYKNTKNNKYYKQYLK